MSLIKRCRSLVPRFMPVEQESNVLHWIAVAFVWMMVEAFVVKSFHREQANIAEMLDWYSRVCSFSGTFWIGAGVYYVRLPSASLGTLEKLTQHVQDVFFTASRHCLVGLSLIMVSFLCQLLL